MINDQFRAIVDRLKEGVVRPIETYVSLNLIITRAAETELPG